MAGLSARSRRAATINAPPPPDLPPTLAVAPALRAALADWLAEGSARRGLAAKTLDAYAADLERDEAAPGSPAPEPSQAPGREAQDCAAADTPIDAPLPADTLASLARALDTGHAVPWRGAYPELPLLDVYRDIWAKVSANRQLRQSEQQVPDNAGPLNSNNLVHRSLALMRQLSPGYLHQFLSYLDALAWMEQFDGAVAAAKEAARGSAKAGAKGAGKAAKPAAAKRSRAKTA